MIDDRAVHDSGHNAFRTVQSLVLSDTFRRARLALLHSGRTGMSAQQRPMLEEEGSQDINQRWPGHRMHLTAKLAK